MISNGQSWAFGGAQNPNNSLLGGTNGPSTVSSVKGEIFSIGFDLVGIPTSSTIEVFQCPYTLNFPANFNTPNSVGSCGVNPSEQDIYTVKVAGSAIGTVTLSTSCVATFATTGGTAQICNAGQRLELDGPATISGSDIGITLSYKR